jgi:CRISPR type III-B/RAMP module-associated protein Cmr3
MTRSLLLDPADTFIVRDGRPFNQDDAGQASAASLFPPPPFTLYGAVRVARARALGWSGYGNWANATTHLPRAAPDIPRRMGDWDQPGELQVCGPFLSEGDGDTRRTFVPAPSNLAIVGSGEVAASGPGDPRLACDLDPNGASFLVRDDPGAKDVSGCWFDIRHLPAYLAAVTTWRCPANADPVPLAKDDDIVATESRVGLAIDRDTRLAEHGQLYASARRRLKSGWKIAVELNLDQFPVGEQAPYTLPAWVPLGSESRFAFIDVGDAVIHQPQIELGDNRYAVLLLTPALVDPPRPDTPFARLPGRVVSAAMGKPVFQASLRDQAPAGGRDNRVRAAVPAGSVVFIQCGDRERPPPTDRRPEPLGEETHAGYGHYLIGRW